MPVWNQFPPGNPEVLLYNYTYWGNLNESDVTSNSYRLDFYGNPSSYIIVEGSGFQFFYDDNEEHLYNVGSVNTMTLYTAAGYPVAQVTDLNLLPNDLLNTLLSNSAAALRTYIESQIWTFNGSAGNDVITGGDQADTIIAHSGDDFVYGLQGVDHLEGGSGNDTLDGGTDADQMFGGTGNDIFFVDNAGDSVIEANETGIDIVNSLVSFSLAGLYVEKLTLTGAAAIDGTGNSFANTLDGSQNGASNTLTGRSGNDTYIVGANDEVVEASGSAAGTMDVVQFIGAAGQSFSLAGQYIERLELLGSAATNGTGNTQANTIIGNGAANIIAGGNGIDTLTGNGGNDVFLFDTAPSASTNADAITDYSVADDTIQLLRSVFSGFNGYGQATVGRFFANTTGLAHDADDRIIYQTDTGRLFYDADGTGATAGVHFATVATGLALTNADFVIV